MTTQSISIKAGDVVEGFAPQELVEIRSVSQSGQWVLVVGVGVLSRREYSRPLTPEQASALTRVRGYSHDFKGDPAEWLLGVEAMRLKTAYQFDPLFAMNASVVDPLPHQIEAVYRYLLPQPRIRFLLADDTGAGKTIMAGLVIKELLFRGAIRKVLVVTPGGLTKQWQEEELQGKFGLDARLVNRPSFDADPRQFHRYDDGIFVVSVDFLARNQPCLDAAKQVQWDMVIVDEAHKLSAYAYGTRMEESERYRALRELSSRTDHLLMLTATPHRGRKDTFRYVLQLLDVDLFQKDELVGQRVREQTALLSTPGEAFEYEAPITHAKNRFFLRRLKEEMVDWNGQPLFKPRYTRTVGYDLTPEEKDLYDRVTAYVRSRRRQARAAGNRNVELTVMVMQRRLASSLYAITRTLENRLAALNDVLTMLRDRKRVLAEGAAVTPSSIRPDDPQDISEYEDLDDDERERFDKRILRQVLSARPRDVEDERDEVEELLKLARGLADHREAKFNELLNVLDSTGVIKAEGEKLLIFTEHRDTMTKLAERLEAKGYSVVTTHGGMNVDERKRAQVKFKTQATIMVATDAAGEGINLQFCRYLINWDIPWNPNRLEQRMGRVHRYGQLGDVRVYNLVAQNTREGSVLTTVLSKLDTMREQMGEDRVYDVIDEWLQGVSLVDLITEAIDADDSSQGGRKAAELVDDAQGEERAKAAIELQRKSSLASKLNLRSARELLDQSEERRIQPLFIQRFFERAWAACGGEMRQDRTSPVWYLGSAPPALMLLGQELRRPIDDRVADPVVFDKSLVSVASPVRVPDNTRLLGPGQPLYDVLLEWAIRNAQRSLAQGTVLADPNLGTPQGVWLVRSVIRDGRRPSGTATTPAHEQLALVVSDRMGMRKTSASYLLDCVAPDADMVLPDVPPRGEDTIRDWALAEITEKQLDATLQARQTECDLRRRYLEETFSYLILELTEVLNQLHQRSLFGEEEEEEAKRLSSRLAVLRQRKQDRLQELDQMLRLSPDMPTIVSHALVGPTPNAVMESDTGTPGQGVPMQRDDEVERIAMEVAMRFERGRGWKPFDVSADGEHYDIRSESPAGEKRFIEVKGRSQTGAVIITGPEVDKLRQLGERAWLYVV
ncbi:DUF3883 domain-containing protein, partial [candidate division WOR-3 bacterium]|nr:DUF3883 domain-containing protein [candidate division WOR-3 bacterium]